MTDAVLPGHSTLDFSLLKAQLAACETDDDLFHSVSNVPFGHKLDMAYLFLGFISFYIVDPATKLVRLAAVSDTEQYRMAVKGYKFKASEFFLSLEDDRDNDIIKSILGNKPTDNTDWTNLSRRKADPGQTRLNQANSGIAYSSIYPLSKPAKGALLFCYYQYPENIDGHQHHFMAEYTHLVSEVLAGRS